MKNSKKKIVNLVRAEIPVQFIDYTNGRYLDCYECHSNRPGCGKDIDWILQRWKRCDMPSPKCVKIIEKIGCKCQFLCRFFVFYVFLRVFI